MREWAQSDVTVAAFEAPGGFVGLAMTRIGVAALCYLKPTYHEAIEGLGEMGLPGHGAGGPVPAYVPGLIDGIRAMLSGRIPGWTVRLFPAPGASGGSELRPPEGSGRVYPVDVSRSTHFERQVYRATCSIPWGSTRSYRWAAGAAGKPGAARAAGNALRSNPVPLLIPCHRVVRSDGSIGGYGGELAGEAVILKARLLAMERGDGGPGSIQAPYQHLSAR